MTIMLATRIVVFTETEHPMKLPAETQVNPYKAKALNVLLWCIPAAVWAWAMILRAMNC